MNALWIAALLSAAPALNPLAREPLANEGECRIARHTFADARVPSMWTAACFAAQGYSFGQHAGSVVIPLLRQSGRQTALAFDAKRAAEFDLWGKPPAWVPARAHERSKTPIPGTPPGFTVLARERDGALLGYSYERGWLRLKPDPKSLFVPEPLFAGTLPPETRTPRAALVSDADPSVKTPWLIYAPDPWRNAEVRVRSPAGSEETVFLQPPRQNGGDFRVTALQAARVKGEARPVVTAIIDGAHHLFTPSTGGKWITATEPAVRPLSQRAAPTGASRVPPCSETVLEENLEEHFDPRFFELDRRLFTVFVAENTLRRQRFGEVLLEEPAQDRLTCDWILDASTQQRALVIAEVTPAGTMTEKLRVQLQQTGFGSTVQLERDGDRLHVVTSSPGFATWLLLALPKL